MPASASTISATNIAFSDGSRPIVIQNGTQRSLVHAGRLKVETSTLEELFLWCVDIFNEVIRGDYDPPLVYTLGTLTDDGNPAGPVALTPDQISRVNGLVDAGDAALAEGTGNTAVISAAYQAAIWQTIYPTLTFRSENPTGPLQALLNTLNADDSFSGAGGILYTPTNEQGEIVSQKLFGAGPDPVNPIPTPAAIGLFGFALAGMLLARRATA